MANHWEYSGDVNLECGGFFWQESGDLDYVYCVDVTPCSDGGGPDNLFNIRKGSIYLPKDEAKLKSALDCCGYDLETATRRDIVDASMAYHGMEDDINIIVRIGKPDEFSGSSSGWNPEPDVILRSNAKLKNYVSREFLSED